LAEHFSRCFVFAMQLREAPFLGDPDELRRRALDVIERASRAARRDGATLEDVRDAEFAVVALIDEAVLSSKWEGKERWAAAPLQLERYERFDAGEVFFDKLEELRRRVESRGVLEVFYLCLATGFRGKYQFLPQDELRTLIEDVQAELLGHRDREGVPLSPNGRPRTFARPTGARSRGAWPIIVGAVVLAAILYAWARFSLGGAAADAAQAAERDTPVAAAGN
jgi:type VI secretion system protein ImpK